MIGVFFAHPKCQTKLEEATNNTQPCPEAQRSLQDDAIDRIKKLHSSIVACFESVSAEGSRMWSPDSVTDTSTSNHLNGSALVITHACLQYLRVLTTSEREGSRWFETVSEMCSGVGTTPSMPRICGRQCHRASYRSSNFGPPSGQVV